MSASRWSHLVLGGTIAVVASPAIAAEAPLSERQVSAAIAPVASAISATRDRLSKLPPAGTDAEKLVRMGELDQASRSALATIGFDRFSDVQRRQIWAAIAEQTQPIDQANQQALLAMVPPEGWFSIRRYGREAAKAAFLIVQHGDQTLWRRFLPAIERMARTGEADGAAYALMYDRLALSEGRPQRFGSQMACRGGRYAPQEPQEDPASLDRRRQALGLQPYAQYVRLFSGQTC